MDVREEQEPRVAVTTTSDAADAKRLAQTLVEERLAACVTVIPKVASTYRWGGEVQTEDEQLLWIKTVASRIEALRLRLLEIHPYDVPEFLVLTVEGASPEYHSWLIDSVAPPESGGPGRGSPA
ncbi:MAG: divalent-cation tolerance protein CutA [Candidatus Eisenbacteria bacterium]|uniref:Divalent-cation tolerance protein CutA n=1 Tax=Eiseniibacteriota bacterium TaxID=2212470 RepID=A0A956NDZ9_UNCEI|nr:divalent-cation tolerance protein CutA [Candidatus Eisenbacteria bacterium]MCB9462742.1 divalent-cation tolerance protein CutA [Candidatus Eisenbacteria bacterium]